jgi:hypothetical protein
LKPCALDLAYMLYGKRRRGPQGEQGAGGGRGPGGGSQSTPTPTSRLPWSVVGNFIFCTCPINNRPLKASPSHAKLKLNRLELGVGRQRQPIFFCLTSARLAPIVTRGAWRLHFLTALQVAGGRCEREAPAGSRLAPRTRSPARHQALRHQAPGLRTQNSADLAGRGGGGAPPLAFN